MLQVYHKHLRAGLYGCRCVYPWLLLRVLIILCTVAVTVARGSKTFFMYVVISFISYVLILWYDLVLYTVNIHAFSERYILFNKTTG